MSRPPQTPRGAIPRGITTRVSTSKITKTVSRTVEAQSSAIAGPSGMQRLGPNPVASSTMKTLPGSSIGTIPKSAGAIPKVPPKAEKQPKKPKEFTLPAFSTFSATAKKGETELEKLKKKNIKRLVAEGENPKMIKEILKAVRDQDILVQEFVAKISPYTGDNGDCLRRVMADEIASFRKLAAKVYETMTQDVNDVLTNEHATLMEYYKEKIEYYTNKMTRCIDEIFDICPNFDFDQYYSPQREEYLRSKFPVPEEYDIDPEELEMLKRQEMYHRMQWLRTEGERLSEENKMLQKRLADLKRQQRQGLMAANEAMQQAEEKKRQLEETEAKMEHQLEVLNESMEKTIYEHERSQTQEARSKASIVRKKPAKKKTSQRPAWNVQAAAEIEGAALQETVQAEVSKVEMSVSMSKSGTKKKVAKSKFKRPPKSGDGAFHFSPIKTPPDRGAAGQRPPSPFHYSPPRSPQERRQAQPRQTSPFHYSPPSEKPPPPTETTRVETTTVVTEERPQSAHAQPRLGRRAASGPKDSWGGFG